MKTKTKKIVNFVTLKKAIREDIKNIKKNKCYDSESKQILLDTAGEFLNILSYWKDYDENCNLIEYKNEIYNFSDSELNETSREVCRKCLIEIDNRTFEFQDAELFKDVGFFDLYMEEQDKVVEKIIKEDGVDPFSFWDFIDDELENYEFSNILALRKQI